MQTKFGRCHKSKLLGLLQTGRSVYGRDKNDSYYIETAVIKIHDRVLSLQEIENWIQTVPRFRDVFIYEKITP